MSYTLVEPCCGGAAFSLHLLGATKALLPYQGSKWKLRHILQQHAESLGFKGPPNRLILTDPGPWGKTIGIVLNEYSREVLIEILESYLKKDPKDIFNSLNENLIPTNEIEYAAQFLFLQRLSFSGKAVGIQNFKWLSPGFNSSSAYGLPATDKFGEVKPMLPSLIKTLKSYNIKNLELENYQVSAQPPKEDFPNTLVYLDPPYSNTTQYPNGNLTSQEVLDLALSWKAAGAKVIISEAIGFDSIGKTLEIQLSKKDASPFKTKKSEWLTIIQ